MRRYQPLDELHRGRATIGRAVDLAFDRVVAIKQAADPADDERVRAEAARLATLAHPSIVPIYDRGDDDDGRPFFAMKRVVGPTLAGALAAADPRGRLPAVVAVASAIAYAHDRGVVHRALAAEHVLLGDFGETVVIGWGHAADGRGREDRRADVAALGALIAQVRGAAPDPDLDAIVEGAGAGRYPEAGALVDDLRRLAAGRMVAARRYSAVARASRFARRQRGWLAAGLLAVVSAAVAIALAPRAHPMTRRQRCAAAGGGAALHAAWNDERRAAVERAFGAVGRSYAPRMAAAAGARLDRAAEALARARIDTCAAELPDRQRELRTACLDQQVARLAATTAVLARADLAIVDAAPATLAGLDDPRACADPGPLARLPPEPVEPALRARLAALRARLAVTEAAITWHREREVVDESRAIAADALALGYGPVVARARYQLGTILAALRASRADAVAGRAELTAAALAADACGDDRTRALALIGLLESWDTADVAGLVALADRAEAAAHRFDDPPIRVRLLHHLAEAARDLGQVGRAATLMQQAYDASGADPQLALDLAMMLTEQGEVARARELADGGLAALRRELGDEHPAVLHAATNAVARVRYEAGDREGAIAIVSEALAVQERVLGPEHKDVLGSREHLAVALVKVGRFAEAAALVRRSRAVVDRVLGPDHELAAQMLETLARAETGLGHLDEARALAEAERAHRLRTLGPEHLKTAEARVHLGKILALQGEREAARTELEAALAIETRVLGAEHEETRSTARRLEALGPARAAPSRRPVPSPASR